MSGTIGQANGTHEQFERVDDLVEQRSCERSGELDCIERTGLQSDVHHAIL